MVVVSGLVAIYYNMIIGWALYYLIASFLELPRDDLPWTKCIKGDASDCECAKYLLFFSFLRSKGQVLAPLFAEWLR